MLPPVAATSLLASSVSRPPTSTPCTTTNRPMKKKMVIHSTSPKVEWMLCAAFSELCTQLSSSIRMAAPDMAMVAGSRCSGRASTKATITTPRMTSDCFNSRQSSILSAACIAVVRRLEVLAPDEMDDHRLHHHHYDDHRREVIDELVEGEPGLRAD